MSVENGGIIIAMQRSSGCFNFLPSSDVSPRAVIDALAGIGARISGELLFRNKLRVSRPKETFFRSSLIFPSKYLAWNLVFFCQFKLPSERNFFRTRRPMQFLLHRSRFRRRNKFYTVEDLQVRPYRNLAIERQSLHDIPRSTNNRRSNEDG